MYTLCGYGAGAIAQPATQRSPPYLKSSLIRTTFIVCLGPSLVLMRRAGFDALGTLLVIAGSVGLGAIAWHIYQRQKKP
ncbi:MAG: hypothetical protein WBG38_11945 [Nodosilinea sp.]